MQASTKKPLRYAASTFCVAALSLVAAPSLAQWTLLDDFESTELGALTSTGGWTTASTDPFVTYPYNIVVDPIDHESKSMRILGGNADDYGTNAYFTLGANSVAEGSTSTLYFKMSNQHGTAPSGDGIGDLAFGTSDVAAPAAWGDYEGYMRFSYGAVDVRDGDGFANATGYGSGVPTNVWLVFDNAADTTAIYTSLGSEEPVLHYTGAFRNGTTDALQTLNLRMGWGQLYGEAFLDDLYIASGTELTMPAGVKPISIVDGDVTLNGVIDEEDYYVIRDNFRFDVTSRSLGDLTGDGYVDFDDFGQWKANATPAALALVLGVPEPAAASLAALALAGVAVRRR